MISRLSIEDMPDRETIKIEGIEYSYELFKAWGIGGFPAGTAFVVERPTPTSLAIRKLNADAT